MPSYCEVKEKRQPLFTPRQVLLSNPNMINQQHHLLNDQKLVLYHSICQFLQLNGFLKTLKKFCNETDVQKDSWKSCSLNLEEVCQEHLQKRSNANGKEINVKQKDDVNHGIEGTKENGVYDGKKSNTLLEDSLVNGDSVKSKKKKKKNSNADDMSNHLNGETNLNETNHLLEDIPSLPSEFVKKSKDKKKKHKHESENSDKEVLKNQAEVSPGKPSVEDSVPQEEKSKSKKNKEDTSIQKDEADREKKGSKKRKKSSSDDNDTGLVEETALGDSKRQKTHSSNQSNVTDQAPQTPKGFANGVSENNDENMSEKQPTSGKAFQRVKTDEVEYLDDRLQDNSYWAKHGADSGYGAKAQEVLGTVKGRGFRHEKTKKKRGSYRGGQIDLQSHSVKFNYEDEDE